VIEVSPAVWWEMRGAPSWRLLEELPAPIPLVFLSQVRSSTLYMWADGRVGVFAMMLTQDLSLLTFDDCYRKENILPKAKMTASDAHVAP
jgi:hypothetical protein